MTVALELTAGGGQEEVLQDVQESARTQAGLRVGPREREILVAVVDAHVLAPVLGQASRPPIRPADRASNQNETC